MHKPFVPSSFSPPMYETRLAGSILTVKIIPHSVAGLQTFSCCGNLTLTTFCCIVAK